MNKAYIQRVHMREAAGMVGGKRLKNGEDKVKLSVSFRVRECIKV